MIWKPAATEILGLTTGSRSSESRGHRVPGYGVCAVRRGGLAGYRCAGQAGRHAGGMGGHGLPGRGGVPGLPGRLGRRWHDTVLARPRDVRRGGDPVAVWWVKSRWKCDEPGCDRKTFTEWLPQVPPRCPRRPGCGSRPPPRSRTAGSPRRGSGTPGSPAAARRTPPPQARQPDQTPRRWRTWGSMSTAAACPAGASMSRPGNTCCSPDRWHLLLRPVRESGAAGPGGRPHRR